MELGARHPISATMNRIVRIFERIGIAVAPDRKKIRTECLLVKETGPRDAQRLEKIAVMVFIVPLGVDADLVDHLPGHGRIGSRGLDEHRPAKPEKHSAVEHELVAFGVSTEVIVIVEDQDSSCRIHIAAINVCR